MLWKSIFLLTSCLLLEGNCQKSITPPLLRQQNKAVEYNGHGNERRLLLKQLNIVGNNGGDNFPLGNCEGDCDNDNDCAGSLKCFQRDTNETIPGCTGDKSSFSGVDFCYNASGYGEKFVTSGSVTSPTSTVPSLAPSSAPSMAPTKRGFRLKLYWEEGYLWQEEATERKWCMICLAGLCQQNRSLEIRYCNWNNTRFEFVGDLDGEVQVQVAWTDLCLELISARHITTLPCNSSNAKQKFTAGRGNFRGDRFELQTDDGCITQSHQPKPEETIYKDTCETARESNTSYWNKF